jgi:hypothetical protein
MAFDDHVIGDFISAGCTIVCVVIAQVFAYYKTKAATNDAVKANTTEVTTSLLAQEDRITQTISDVSGAAKHNSTILAQLRDIAVKGKK